MQITRIEVDNFKSLVDFRLPLAKFSCLIGLNGAGKSTVLQAVDFLSQLFKGDMSDWLEQRQWKAADLNSKLVPKSNIDLSLHLVAEGVKVVWKGQFNRTSLRCTHETLSVDDNIIFKVGDGAYSLKDSDLDLPEWLVGGQQRITFKYEGSLLSQLKEELLPPTLQRFKAFMQKTISLDLLAPQYLRQRTRESLGGLGLGGERLSAFLHELSPDKIQLLEDRLRQCYPQLSGINTSSLRSGWKQLVVEEEFAGGKLKSEARHVNDGMLRLMAILAEILTDNKFLLFDEIENGVNPELVEFLLDVLVETKKQILVTTHSPMILNYLDDDVARAGVQYIYKTPEGYSRSIPFFAIPSMAKKLEVMGPGEVFVDTELTGLFDEIANLTVHG